MLTCLRASPLRSPSPLVSTPSSRFVVFATSVVDGSGLLAPQTQREWVGGRWLGLALVSVSVRIRVCVRGVCLSLRAQPTLTYCLLHPRPRSLVDDKENPVSSTTCTPTCLLVAAVISIGSLFFVVRLFDVSCGNAVDASRNVCNLNVPFIHTCVT